MTRHLRSPSPELSLVAKVELFSDSSCNTSVSPQEPVLSNESTVNIIVNTITSEGTVTYYTRQIDEAGNESSCSIANLSYEYDETIPDRPSRLRLHDPSTSPSNDPTPEIIVSGVEPLAKVELFREKSCSISVSPQVSVLPDESTVNIIVNTIASDGTITYYVHQIDQAGNKSHCSIVKLSYEYDETIPNAPLGLSLHDPPTSPGNDPTPEITVSEVEARAKVQLFSDSSCNTSVSPQESVLPGESTVNIIANAFATYGTLTYYAHQIDQAGNTSECSSSSLVYQYTSSSAIKEISIEYGNYLVGESIIVSVEFGKDVIVDTSDGVPRLALLVGSSTQYATYHLGSGSSKLTFIYIVGQQEIDKDGISITSPIDLQGGSIKSISLEEALLTFTSPRVFSRVFVNFPELNLGATGLNCSDTAPRLIYSNYPSTDVYKVSSNSFYIIDISGLTEEVQQFEFCLSRDLKITAELNQSYITENNSLVWEGQVADTPVSLAHQVANSIIFVERNSEIIGTVWADGYLYRIWPLGGGLYQIEEIAGSGSVLDEPHVMDLPIPEEINTGESIPEISIMTVFTSNANEKVRDIYAFSELAIAEANFGYRASSIKARLKLVHAVAHSYRDSYVNSNTDLARIINPNDGYMDDIHELRDQYEVDIGVLVNDRGSGYVKKILEPPKRAFSIVGYGIATGVYAFSHEVGHLLGAQHEASLGDMGLTSKPYAFGHGYVDPKSNNLGAWRTVMAYDNCGGCFQINIWSNPNITILGEPAGNAVFSDNARVLNMNASAFASFRGETYADLSGEGIVLQNGSVMTNISEKREKGVLYVIEVPAGATNLRIETSGGTGDVDLHVKAKAMAVPGFYDCAPKKHRNNEVCVFEYPEAVRYHVLLYGYNDFSGVRLEIQYDEPGN